MFKQTFTVIRTNLALYGVFLMCCIGLDFLDEYSEKSTSGVVSIMLLAFLGLNVQNSILKSMNFTAAAKKGKLPIGRYMLKTMTLLLLCIVITVVCLVLVFPKNGKSSPYFGVALVSSFIVGLTIVMSLLGTWLPATLHGVNTSLADAFRRGRSRFFSTGARVLAGIGIPLLLLFAALMVMHMVSGLESLESGRPNVVAIIFTVASSATQAVGWTYISVVFARRYMEAENIAPASQELLTVFT